MELNKINNEPINHDVKDETDTHIHKNLINNKEDTTEKTNKRRLKNEILDELVFPEIKLKISESASIQRMWDFCAGFFITLKYMMASVSMVFVFLASSSILVDKQSLFALIGGLLHVCSLVCEQMGKYASYNSEKSLKNKNELLESIGINYKEPDTHFIDSYDLDQHHSIVKIDDVQRNNAQLTQHALLQLCSIGKKNDNDQQNNTQPTAKNDDDQQNNTEPSQIQPIVSIVPVVSIVP
jgi:hypothetical protein